MSAPSQNVVSGDVPAAAAGADDTTNLGTAPFAGTVSAVSYVADAAITGAATDSRTVSLVNKGQAGAGTTVVATLALVEGVNAAAADETAITLSVVANATKVVAGDVLQWTSTHVGSTGLADPGGLVRVTLTRGNVSS